MSNKAYWSNSGKGTGVAPAEARQPITDEQMQEAADALAAIAKRVRDAKESE